MILINDKFKEFSTTKCDDIDLEAGEKLAAELFKHLNKSKSGVGLAAPQIGELKRVCVINVKYPMYLINPRIVKSEGEIVFYEGCLSYPNQAIRTKRFTNITVEADNFEGNSMDFTVGNDLDTLECVAVQHEIDHLNGVLMFDRQVELKPVVAKKKIGRNELVTITNNNDNSTKILKYKKAMPLLNTGEWVFTNMETT